MASHSLAFTEGEKVMSPLPVIFPHKTPEKRDSLLVLGLWMMVSCDTHHSSLSDMATGKLRATFEAYLELCLNYGQHMGIETSLSLIFYLIFFLLS